MKSILKYMPSVIISTICTIVITILYGNYLTPDQYGKLNIFTTTISILDVIFLSFISLSIIRFYIIYKNDYEVNLLSTYFISLMVSLAIIFLMGYLIVGKGIFYIIIACSGYGLFIFYSNLLRVCERTITFNIIRVLVPISTIVLLLLNIIIFNKLSLKSVIISSFGPYFVVSLLLTVIYIIKGKIRFEFDFSILKRTMKYGIPLIGVGLLNLLLAGADRYMIDYYLGSYQVGIYSFGYRIAELSMINMTHIIIMGIYPNLIFTFEKKGKKDAEILLTKVLNIHCIIVIPIIFNLLLFIKDIIGTLFKSYIGAEYIVILIAFGTIFYSISFYVNKAFELTKNTKKMLISLFIATIINIILNIILIPNIKIIGAVVSTLISYIVYIILSIRLSKNLFEVKSNNKNILIIILLNFITFIIVYILSKVLPSKLLINVIIGGISYLLIYSLMLYIFIKNKFLLL